MIEFKSVSKVYGNGVKGLDDISLKIEQGEFIAIIGLSGAGKSTFIRAINRLHEITSGEILVNGSDIGKLEGKELRHARRNIGIIAQHFNLVKRVTVQQNILTGRLGYYSTLRSIFGMFKPEDYERTKEALKTVGLEDKLHNRCDELSGGQQQRISIARALVQEADIILADEPVASLDPITSDRIMNVLKTINEEMNRTIIINIHSVELARRFATRIIGLRSGQVVYDGKSADTSDEVLIEIYGDEIMKPQKRAKDEN